MFSPDASKTATPDRVRSLTQLRWAAAGGQAITVLVANLVVGLSFPYAPLFAIIAFECLLSVVSTLLLRGGFRFGPGHLRFLLLLDVLALAALLHFSGGAENPFSFLFLVHIVLAAILLGPRDAWALTAVSASLFGALFYLGPRVHNHDLMVVHLQGMWVAFLIASALIVTFVGRILRQLEQRQAELDDARARAARAETASKLGMLATGAAHELATPLATITLVSDDILGYSRSNPDPARLAEDATLLRSEVGRCRRIIEDMASEAGTSFGEGLVSLPVGELVEGALDRVSSRSQVELRFGPGVESVSMRLAPKGFARALASLVQNGIDASPDGARVTLEVRLDGEYVQFAVEDSGRGIPPELLGRVTDPFFTTKPTGKGLGLGLFFAETVLTELGGRLEVGNRTAVSGVRAIATVPRCVTEPPAGRRPGA